MIEHVGDSDTKCNCCDQYNSQRITKGTGGLGNKRTSSNHPNDSIIEISKNSEKSPRDLRRLKTPVEKPSANAGVKNS